MAQSEGEIANTSVQLKGNKVQITYDILNTEKAARFIVSVEILDSEGKPLKVNALEGDIGEVSDAGKKKTILWDPAVDGIFLNTTIDIQVSAEMILPPPSIEPEPDSQAKETTIPSEVSTPPYAYKRTAIMLQSVALPGLGLSRLTGKPHWIKGVAGYGCIAGAIVFNKKAVTSYESYGRADSHDEANALFNTTTKQNNISKGFAFTALAIWAVDLTWTLIGTKDLKKGSTLGFRKGASLDADYDVISNTPLLSLKYSF